MKLYIEGINKEIYGRNLHHIANLFFEDSKMMYELGEEEPDAIVTLSMEGDAIFSCSATLEGTSDRTIYRAEEKKDLSHLTEDELRKKKKHIIGAAYLRVLEQWTKIKQPWGVLTGIRPTKLYHSFRKKGLSKEECAMILEKDYYLSKEKIQLLENIVDRQLTVVKDLYRIGNEISLYIGIPFCPTKCAYCTFPAYAINRKEGNRSVNAFLEGLHYEMKEIGSFLKKKNIKVTTVYFGGGTPTSITAEEMDELYTILHDYFPHMKSVREITVEAGRPDTITVDKLKVLKKHGIDRISINPQSYIQDTLDAIGRHHTVEETIDKYHLAREYGMNNINMDLIIGLPGEGINEFTTTLNETEKLMPESLTIHTLSFKRASEMTQNKKKYPVSDRLTITKMMELGQNWTKENGYAPYYLYRQKNILGNLENVGYAQDGQDSIYNIMIMEEEQTILGLGCGAASKFVHPKTKKIVHYNNPKDPKSYFETHVAYTHEKIDILEELFSEVHIDLQN